MAQAEGITTGAKSATGGEEPMSATAELLPSEAITAAATEVVAGALTTAHGRCSNPGAMDKLTPDAATSATITEKLAEPADADNLRDGTLTDRQAGASPRPMKPGGDLRGSFLAAVGNTISQAVRCTFLSHTDVSSYCISLAWARSSLRAGSQQHHDTYAFGFKKR